MPNPHALIRLEPVLQVRAGAKHAARPRHHDTSDPVIDVEQRKDVLELAHHRVGEGVVLAGPVQRQLDYRRRLRAAGWDVVEFYLRCGKGCVGGWEA